MGLQPDLQIAAVGQPSGWALQGVVLHHGRGQVQHVPRRLQIIPQGLAVQGTGEEECHHLGKGQFLRCENSGLEALEGQDADALPRIPQGKPEIGANPQSPLPAVVAGRSIPIRVGNEHRRRQTTHPVRHEGVSPRP